MPARFACTGVSRSGAPLRMYRVLRSGAPWRPRSTRTRERARTAGVQLPGSNAASMKTMSKSRGARFLVDAVEPHDVVCPEDMGDDERLLMQSIREFAEQEVAPLLDEIDRRDIEVIRPLFKKAADLGIFMAEVPETHGGLGLSPLAVAGMNECRSYLGGLASTVFAHQGIGTLPLVNFGTPAQIDRYLDRCMRGELMAAFALTEPEAGSDAMSIRTTAVLDPEGTHYVVNGSKQWITNAGWADLFILFAKVDGAAFSAFLLERDTPGVTVGPHERLLGLQGSSVCAMQLDDVAVPVDNLLGEVGQGHRVALCTLNVGRMKMGANCAGSAKKVLATTTRYAAERRQFGRPIAEFGLIQRKLADMAARAWGAESVAYRTAGLVYAAIEELGRDGADSLDVKLRTFAEFSVECAMAKVIGSEAYHAVADDALQVYGGYGFSEEYPAARWYRDSRITRIYEGTSEICRLSIAKTLLKRADRGELERRARAARGGGHCARPRKRPFHRRRPPGPARPRRRPQAPVPVRAGAGLGKRGRGAAARPRPPAVPRGPRGHRDGDLRRREHGAAGLEAVGRPSRRGRRGRDRAGPDRVLPSDRADPTGSHRAAGEPPGGRAAHRSPGTHCGLAPGAGRPRRQPRAGRARARRPRRLGAASRPVAGPASHRDPEIWAMVQGSSPPSGMTDRESPQLQLPCVATTNRRVAAPLALVRPGPTWSGCVSAPPAAQSLPSIVHGRAT